METIKKTFLATATFKKDVNGKRKIVDIHFPIESIRQIIDIGFIKSGRRNA